MPGLHNHDNEYMTLKTQKLYPLEYWHLEWGGGGGMFPVPQSNVWGDHTRIPIIGKGEHLNPIFFFFFFFLPVVTNTRDRGYILFPR